LTLRPRLDAAFAIDGEWDVTVPGPTAQAWILTEAPLDVREVQVDGVQASLLDAAGTRLWLSPGVHRVVLHAEAVGDVVPLAPAGVQRARVLGDAAGRTLVGLPTEDGWIVGGPAAVTWTTPPARRDEGRLLATRWAVGLDVDEDAVRGRARLTLLPARGDLTGADIALSGIGDDVQITAPAGVSWSRRGDLLSVALDRPRREPVTLGLTWTTALVGEVAAIPVPEADAHGAFRREEAFVLGRDASVGVVPELRGGQPTASAMLPEWATNLSTGTPVLARVGPTSGTVRALRLSPLQAPPVFVDAANWDALVTTDERYLARGTWTVRNDRAGALRVVLPPGCVPWLATVDGQPTPVSIEADGAIRIALPRSVESVGGLLAFPVVLVVQGTTGHDELALPSPQAPVGVRRVTVHLAAGVRAAADGAADGRVPDFDVDEALRWDFGGGGIEAAQAEALYRDAVSAWLDNDTEAATSVLDLLAEQGVDNANIQGLRGNLAAVMAPSKNAEDTGAQRILAQAAARALDDQRAQEDALARAEQALAAGDESIALEALEEADRAAKKMGTAGGERREANLARTDSLRDVYGKDKASGKFVQAPSRAESKPEDVVWETLEDGSRMWHVETENGTFGGVIGGVASGVLGGVAAPPPTTPEPLWAYDTSTVDDLALDPLPTGAAVDGEGSPSLGFDDAEGGGDGIAEVDGLVEARPSPGRGRAPAPEEASNAVARPSAPLTSMTRAPAAKPAFAPPPPPPTGAAPTVTAAPAADEPAPDIAAAATSTPLTAEFLASIPTGRSFQQAVEVEKIVVARGPVDRWAKVGAKEAPSPAPIDRPDVPPVVSTRADLQIPDGTTVLRFQHTLLREGDVRPLRLRLVPDHGRHGPKESR
jgi:hypothetical protein